VTPLDAKLVLVPSVFGRDGAVTGLAGDYGASKIAYSAPTQRWESSTFNRVREAITHLTNGHPTNGLNVGRGVFDDFISPTVSYGSTLTTAAASGTLLTTAANISQGVVRFQPDGGTLQWSATAEGCGQWTIAAAATPATDGGLLYIPQVGLWPTSSRYAVRMTAKVTIPVTTGTSWGTFVGATLNSSISASNTALSNKKLGFWWPGFLSSGMHELHIISGAGDATVYTVPYAIKTFEVSITASLVKGCHLKLTTADTASNIEVYDPTPFSSAPLAFAVIGRTQSSATNAIVRVDYMSYQMLDLG
jgi:hypothetical protein